MLIQSIRYKAFALLAMLALVGTIGCRHSDDPCPPGVEEPEVPLPDPDKLTLCLNISFEGQGIQTRADDNDPNGNPPYEGPEGIRETVNTLRVIIVRDSLNTNEELVKREVEANRLVTTSPEGYPLYDNLQFKVIANENKRIYLIANESSLTAPAGKTGTASEFLDSFKVGAPLPLDYSKSELAEWTVSLSDITNADIDGIVTEVTTVGIFPSVMINDKIQETRIPLTEFFDIYVNGEEAIDDICYSNLFMTRAAAKASFYLDPTGLANVYDDVKITSISLSGIGFEEYVFPNGAEYSKGKQQDTSDLDIEMYIKKFNTPSDRTLTYLRDNLNIDMVPKDVELGTEPRRIFGPIYFPESILKTKDDKYQVTVTLNTGVTFTASLVENILNFDDKDALARNTHLKIVLSFTPKGFDAEVRVAPYIGIDLDPVFGSDALIKPPKPRE